MKPSALAHLFTVATLIAEMRAHEHEHHAALAAADMPPADRAATIAAALPSLETDRFLTGVRQFAMERGGTLNPQDDPAKQTEKQTRELVALAKKNNETLGAMLTALDKNKLVAIVAGSPG